MATKKTKTVKKKAARDLEAILEDLRAANRMKNGYAAGLEQSTQEIAAAQQRWRNFFFETERAKKEILRLQDELTGVMVADDSR